MKKCKTEKNKTQKSKYYFTATNKLSTISYPSRTKSWLSEPANPYTIITLVVAYGNWN